MNRLESLVVPGLFTVAGVVVAFVTGSADGVITYDSTGRDLRTDVRRRSE
jgi:hypothetical protein